MDSSLLEQGVYLALGWCERVAYLQAHPEELSTDDKPAGITLSDSSFLALQQKLAQEASLWWSTELRAFLQHFNTLHEQLSKKQKALFAAVEGGKLRPTQANEKARTLSTQLEEATEEIGFAQKLLALLKNPPYSSLPTLPLCRYSVSNHTLTKEYQSCKTRDFTKDTGYGLKLTARLLSIKTAFQSLSLTDRTALTLALIFSLLIIIGGAAFTLRDAGISLSLKANAAGHYDVSVINRSKQTLFLSVPYDGKRMDKNDTPTYAVVVELLENSKPSKRNPPLEHLWFYKEKPAYLKGPILLTPLSEEKLQLHIPTDLSDTPDALAADQIRLTVYKAPGKKKASYTFTLNVNSPESE
ncbi:MAG: hypothetical protein GX130_03550 [Candidatus Hydrogenedens sp.]|jgi:hypothetical protein|nr:hypothetical protein [Candidatus Hydrogenedens sp.]